jgi:plasmid maintenance system antidote protein VapI
MSNTPNTTATTTATDQVNEFVDRVNQKLADGGVKAAAKPARTRKAPAKTTTKAPAKTTTANATTKAPAKTTAKAPAAKKETAPKPPAKQGQMVTKTGVKHPGTYWLAAMEKANLSQTATANAMGVAPMTLNRLINGHGIPTAKVTILFAEATGSDVKELWTQVSDWELALAQETTAKK